ncbi:heterokaryon incompatibility protein-domain-containing protein [Phlebopus sp. FC_14]|nr:heterokaryon incompatibility protein-domain-containing protein [Phlebopus sp. FC_14]
MPRKPKRGSSRAHNTDPPSSASQDCLCLICRQVGHLVRSCPQFSKLKGASEDVKLSDEIQTPHPFNIPFIATKGSPEALCQRCKQLGNEFHILASGHQSGKVDKYMEKVKRRLAPIPPLGPVTSIRLLSTCPFCRFMFDITYLSENDLRSIVSPQSDDEGQLALMPTWTLVHLDPVQDVWPEKGWGPHSLCIYTAVTRARDKWQPQIGVHSGVDAIGVMDPEGNGAGAPALGVRKVGVQTPDYGIIKEWFRRCDELHQDTCRPLVSENLKKIKLVDVETRQIVGYRDGFDYIALSYVWGGVTQRAYKLGDTLPRTPPIPATLEDAMEVVRHLGKRYLWVDSLCIDQGNAAEKDEQIPLMSAIYTGAWATIFNVAGQSANSGLPRVSTRKDVIPQMCYTIGGQQLLSLMPPLSQQISRSLWDSRAWTFQEGLLSPRRLFFTNHQVYFECNLVQCCESLDESHSPFHLTSNEQRAESARKALNKSSTLVFSDPDETFAGGVLRDPFRPIFESKKRGFAETFRLYKYEELLYTYTGKKMSEDVDSLNAFTAILKRFEETHYKKGFVQGLPVEDLPTALLWIHSDEVRPRRRAQFPPWSWAGWEGAVIGASTRHVRGTTDKFRVFEKRYLPPLRIWRAGTGGRPELVYDFNPTLDEHRQNEGSDEDGEGEADDESDDDERATPDSDDQDGSSAYTASDNEGEGDTDSAGDAGSSDGPDSDGEDVNTDEDDNTSPTQSEDGSVEESPDGSSYHSDDVVSRRPRDGSSLPSSKNNVPGDPNPPKQHRTQRAPHPSPRFPPDVQERWK